MQSTKLLVLTNLPDRAMAEKLADLLISKNLAACVNILDGMRSIYRWEGRIEEAAEAVLLIKTEQARTQAVIDKVKELHSYSCPCVAIWPLSAGNPEYLDWIRRESRDA